MNKRLSENWLAWDILVELIDAFFDQYYDDKEMPIDENKQYELIQFILKKKFED